MFIVLFIFIKFRTFSMNYLTAIIAGPTFTLLWLLELWMVFYNGINRKVHSLQCYTLILVSTLQMISCWFWFAGFYNATLIPEGNVLSEANNPGEVSYCPGLVGAEVILSIFQYIMSMLSIYTVLQLYSIQPDNPSVSGKIVLNF